MLQILFLLLVFVLIAFFSGIEIAFLSANKLRIELGKNKGSISGKVLSEFNEASLQIYQHTHRRAEYLYDYLHQYDGQCAESTVLSISSCRGLITLVDPNFLHHHHRAFSR
jgi:hypothetical protein